MGVLHLYVAFVFLFSVILIRNKVIFVSTIPQFHLYNTNINFNETLDAFFKTEYPKHRQAVMHVS